MRRRKTRKIRRGLIRYGATTVRHQGLTRQQTEKQPDIMFVGQTGKQYTLIMYDPDAQNPAYLHWLLVNLTPQTSAEQIMYEPPNPPRTDKHYHRYMFELLEQQGHMELPNVERQGFEVQAFKQKHGLQRIASTGFYVMP